MHLLPQWSHHLNFVQSLYLHSEWLQFKLASDELYFERASLKDTSDSCSIFNVELIHTYSEYNSEVIKCIWIYKLCMYV